MTSRINASLPTPASSVKLDFCKTYGIKKLIMQAHTQNIRRQDKAVTDQAWIEEVLQHGQLLSLAMVEADGSPYVVT
ncbi:MAG: hypothetical protein ACRCWR_06665, partial [Saezia sp.]